MMDYKGNTVKMEARLSGSQPLEVTWYKENHEIHASDKYDILFKNHKALLSVRECSTSDSAEYTCTASNETGKASCRVSLTIPGMSVAIYLKQNIFMVRFVS